LFTQRVAEQKANSTRPMNVKKPNERFLAVLAALNLPAGREASFTLHSLRHFFETFTVNHGIPQRVVTVRIRLVATTPGFDDGTANRSVDVRACGGFVAVSVNSPSNNSRHTGLTKPRIFLEFV
jgi:hypothetical protein